MRVVLFCHSLRSDWNHGNAHFLRGVTTDLAARGHDVRVFEPRDGWSAGHLAAEVGPAALEGYRAVYPLLNIEVYDRASLDPDRMLEGADVVIVHEWSERDLVARIGAHRAARGGYQLFFHDTHHRSVSEPASMRDYDLRHYDGVLAFGDVIRRRYLSEGWISRAWTWHEAADVRVFRPMPGVPLEGDLVWIGNWGDDERADELEEFLLEPVRILKLRARVYGVRYPADALRRLEQAGIEYAGWVPNYHVPEVFARHRVTIHVPRRPYVQVLRGVPTIRPFEALACGIPLISAPWDDAERLFAGGRDFLVARNGREMQDHIARVLGDPGLAADLARRGRARILERHTCAHRVDELLALSRSLDHESRPALPAVAASELPS